MGTGNRLRFTEEASQFMIKLWTEKGPVSFSGKYFTTRNAEVEPKPVQKPYPEIWFGSHGPKTIRMTGGLGSGWIPVGPRWVPGESYPKPDAYAEMRKIILEELAKRGKSGQDFVFSILINIADINRILLEEIESYIAAGMNYFNLGTGDLKSESSVKKVRSSLEEIVPSL